ncbi:AAA family ATPase [Nonomuraea sp. SYSU D8015]|uniref:AAA family ATPase n=1 Tax=Nonomuraea sp. SYSU D8015 TaxID=2593644 RepID=UPI001660F57E|nr:ATP-binding protein [Nonomuraea sp. SYSU D8015]
MTLVGREGALEVVGRVLTAGSGCVVVEGPAGIGKSRLLEEAAGRGRSMGATVAFGRATELDRVAPLSTLLRPLTAVPWHSPGSPPTGSGFPPTGSGSPPAQVASHPTEGGFLPTEDGPLQGGGGDGFLLIERLGEAIERFSRDRRLVIVLDDVQWADELTCLALRRLVPGSAASPVVWLLSRRLLPEQEAVERLIAEGAAVRLPLPPLTPEEAAELSRRLLRAEPGPAVLELARASGGNPFLLEEALTGLRDEGRIEVTDGTATITGQPVCAGAGVTGERLVSAGAGVAGGGLALPSGFVAAVERRLRAVRGGAAAAGGGLGAAAAVHGARGGRDARGGTGRGARARPRGGGGGRAGRGGRSAGVPARPHQGGRLRRASLRDQDRTAPGGGRRAPDGGPATGGDGRAPSPRGPRRRRGGRP